jgi:hypothetical protein
MFPVYTADQLSALSLPEIKVIAGKIGATPTADLRKRASWVQAVLDSQVAKIQSVADELVAEITADIDAVADAAQAAVYQGDSEAHSNFEQRMTESLELLANVQAKINSQLEEVQGQMASIRGVIARIDAVITPPQIWWYDNTKGTVTIAGEKRQFEVLALYGNPTVQVLSSAGTWIDSRWHTAKNNRYINAVLAAIPSHIQTIHDRILLSDSVEYDCDNEIWDGDDFLGYSEDQPPGRGDGRDRVEAVANNDEF